jgi:hypothetical protein
MTEILKGLDGKATDSQGHPYNEELSQKEGRRGMFQRTVAVGQGETASRVIPATPDNSLPPPPQPTGKK